MKKDTLTITKPGMVCAVALLCCLLWGSAFPSIKIGYRLFEIAESDSMSQLLFAGYRFSLAGIMVIVIGSFMSGRILCPKCSSWSMVIRLGAVQTIFQYVFFYMGLAHTTGVKSSIITASNVFFAIFLSAVVFREKITPGKMTGCIIGFAGVVLINLTGAGIDLNLSFAGEGAIMLSAFASALSSVLIKRYSAKEDTFTLWLSVFVWRSCAFCDRTCRRRQGEWFYSCVSNTSCIHGPDICGCILALESAAFL